MNGILVFLAEVAASVAISMLVLVRLQHLLRRLGNEACAQGGGATEFWVAYTQIMMLVAPVLLIAYYSQADELSRDSSSAWRSSAARCGS